MSRRPTHKSAEVPVVEVCCEVHAGRVVGRFGKVPAGNWIGIGTVEAEKWMLLAVWFDASIDDKNQMMRRPGDQVAYIDPDTKERLPGYRPGAYVRYNLYCDLCAGRNRRGATKVPVRDERLQQVGDTLAAAVTLPELAAKLRSHGAR